jgi:hypothetical protein
VSIPQYQPTPWTASWFSQPTSGGSFQSAPVPAFDATTGAPATGTDPDSIGPGGFGPVGPGPQPTQGTSQASGPSGAFDSLAADIQAMLIQAQNAAGTSGSVAADGSATTGTPAVAASGLATSTATTAANLEASLASDLQALMSGQASSQAAGTQTANVNPDQFGGRFHSHGHHHHHHGTEGGDAVGNGTAAVASNAATSDQSAGAGVQQVSQTLAADIAQAIQSYANMSNGASGTGVLG